MNPEQKQIARITDLERANYAATIVTTRLTPGAEVILRDDVIITSTLALPSPDLNHACLLQSTPQGVDNLLAEVIDYFKSKGMPTTVFVSPACTPANLPEHLLKRGFVELQIGDAWLTLYLPNFEIPPISFPNIVIREILPDEAMTFAEIFLTAFEMPADFAPYLAQLLEPSLSLPTIHHYIALVNKQPIGICSMLYHENFCILGSAGVVPTHRKSGAATCLAIKAIMEAQEQGSDTVIVQTTNNEWLERVLYANGFEKAFTRTCYTLPE